MLIFLSFNKAVGGAGPTLFSFNKITDTVKKVGPLFPDYSPYTWQTGEGWYFSAPPFCTCTTDRACCGKTCIQKNLRPSLM